MQKWEYHRFTGSEAFDRKLDVIRINEMGRQGWELVSHTQLDTGRSIYLFKRPIEDQAEELSPDFIDRIKGEPKGINTFADRGDVEEKGDSGQWLDALRSVDKFTEIIRRRVEQELATANDIRDWLRGLV